MNEGENKYDCDAVVNSLVQAGRETVRCFPLPGNPGDLSLDHWLNLVFNEWIQLISIWGENALAGADCGWTSNCNCQSSLSGLDWSAAGKGEFSFLCWWQDLVRHSTPGRWMYVLQSCDRGCSPCRWKAECSATLPLNRYDPLLYLCQWIRICTITGYNLMRRCWNPCWWPWGSDRFRVIFWMTFSSQCSWFFWKKYCSCTVRNID